MSSCKRRLQVRQTGGAFWEDATAMRGKCAQTAQPRHLQFFMLQLALKKKVNQKEPRNDCVNPLSSTASSWQRPPDILRHQPVLARPPKRLPMRNLNLKQSWALPKHPLCQYQARAALPLLRRCSFLPQRATRSSSSSALLSNSRGLVQMAPAEALSDMAAA